MTILDAQSGASSARPAGRSSTTSTRASRPTAPVVFERNASDDSGQDVRHLDGEDERQPLRQLAKAASTRCGRPRAERSPTSPARGSRSRCAWSRPGAARAGLSSRATSRTCSAGRPTASPSPSRRAKDRLASWRSSTSRPEGAQPPPALLRADSRLVVGLERAARQQRRAGCARARRRRAGRPVSVSGAARCRRATPVTAPVRIAETDVPSITASGSPVAGSVSRTSTLAHRRAVAGGVVGDARDPLQAPTTSNSPPT